MPSRLALLLLAAATLACAAAARPGDVAGVGRSLLQTPTSADCDRSVMHCNTCRYQFYRGTVTKAICTKCETGYVVKNSGRACFCAPGYYTTDATNVDGQTGFTCNACGPDAWCPGAKVTAESSTVRYTCGANKITTTEYAKSDRECVVKPGFGWAAGEDSVECPQGFYNPGYNTRKCTKCPGSLTTLGTNSNSTQDCLAPSGYYYLRGKAVACARGTYKNYIGNNDCDECPTGMSTPANAVAQLSKLTCNVVLAGYSLAATPSLGVTAAEECPQDTYRNGESTGIVDQQAGSVDCVACGDNMVTLPNTTRATSSDACVVPPGYGWVAPLSGTKGTAVKCAVGWYNPGYNREPCIRCGNGSITTDAQGSTSADQCYTPAGHGNRRDPVTGTLEGFQCDLNTYGRPENTYGLVDVECTKCQEGTVTLAPGSTDSLACVTKLGYGWEDGAAVLCDYGYYGIPFSHEPCTYCGDFYHVDGLVPGTGWNTSATNGATQGVQGGQNPGWCYPGLGYQYVAPNGLTLEACLRGWYKDTIAFGICSQCPAGTSTTVTAAAVAISDCDTCRPGWGTGIENGVGTDKIADLTSPTCWRCPPGTYSSGFAQGGQRCLLCPQSQNFTGAMTSPYGSWTPEQCVGEFTSDADNEQNFAWWDVISFNDSATFVYMDTYTDLETCQIQCNLDTMCQYFQFYKTGAPSTVDNSCYHRTGGALLPVEIYIAGSPDNGDTFWNAPSSLGIGLVLFEVKEGIYAVYSKTMSEVIGATLDLTALGADPADFKATRTACDASEQCIGLTWDAAGWRAFTGARWQDAIGKVRVAGAALNTWVDLPTGREEPEGWSPTSGF